MRKWIAVLLLLGLTMDGTAFAGDGGGVEYVNGTVMGLTDGIIGTLDTSSVDALEFRSGTEQFSISYAEISTVKCREENRFRLGVLPAIAVGLIKARAKRHLVTIEWKHSDNLPEVVTFDASKEKSRGVLAVLRARAPHACRWLQGQACTFGE